MNRPKPEIRFIGEEDEEQEFTTDLSPIEEGQFMAWYRKMSETLQLSPNPDDRLHYYDYRGYWKENPLEILERGDHFGDKFKRPGHPTFSDQSQYSAQKGGSNIYGGVWDGKNFVHSKDTDQHADRTDEYLEGSGEEAIYEGGDLEEIEVTPQYDSSGSVSSEKAKEILRHGTIRGKGITDKQKRYFGFIAGGGKPKYHASGYIPYAHTHAPGEDRTGHDAGEKKLDVTASGVITPEELERRKTQYTIYGSKKDEIEQYETDEITQTDESQIIYDDPSSRYTERTKMNPDWVTKNLWENRYEGDIKYLTDTELSKFLQKERLQDRVMMNDFIITPTEMALLNYKRPKKLEHLDEDDNLYKSSQELEETWCPEGLKKGCLGSANAAYDLRAEQAGLPTSMQIKEKAGVLSQSKEDMSKRYPLYEENRSEKWLVEDKINTLENKEDINETEAAELSNLRYELNKLDEMIENDENSFKEWHMEFTKNHPYLSGPTNLGDAFHRDFSPDSWTLPAAYVKQGGTLLYNRMDHVPKLRNGKVDQAKEIKTPHGDIFEMDIDGKYLYPDKVKDLWSTISVGSIFSMGSGELAIDLMSPKRLKEQREKRGKPNYNQEELGMAWAGHSLEVVGWTPSGEPIVYDGFYGPKGTLVPNTYPDEEGNNITEYEVDAYGAGAGRGYHTFSNMLMTLWKRGYRMQGITAPPGTQKNTFKNMMEEGTALEVMTNYDTEYVRSLANLLEDNKLELGDSLDIDVNATQKFVDTLGNIKANFKNLTGMGDEEYDTLADIAVALGINETSGMGGSFKAQGISHPLIDREGDTQGFTQLNMENITGKYGEDHPDVLAGVKKKGDIRDELLNKRYKQLNARWKESRGRDLDIQNPEDAAALTMIYISEAHKRAMKDYNTGRRPSERTFKPPTDEQITKSYIKNPQASLPFVDLPGGSTWNDDGFLVADTDVRIDTNDYIGDSFTSLFTMRGKTDKQKAAALQQKLNSTYTENTGLPGIYTVNVEKEAPKTTTHFGSGDSNTVAKPNPANRFSITKQTKGNKPNLSQSEIMDYYWQSPTSLRTGDAEGKSRRAQDNQKISNAIKELRTSGEKYGDQEKAYSQQAVDYVLDQAQGLVDWFSEEEAVNEVETGVSKEQLNE